MKAQFMTHTQDDHGGLIAWDAPDADLYVPTWVALNEYRGEIGRNEALTKIEVQP